MNDTPPELPEETLAQIAQVGPREIVIGLPTYNHAETVAAVVERARAGLEQYFPGAPAAFIDADAGSSDGTLDIVAAAGLPAVVVPYAPPLPERANVPFHGVPGRGQALHAAVAAAHRLGARVLVLLEADVVSAAAEWVAALARPVWEEKADLVLPLYARHRYDGTITNLLLSPLVRALYGRRVHQPFGGQQAFSGRLLEHLLTQPAPNWSARDVSDLWIVGTAIAERFGVWEAWLGPHRVRSHTRTTELPEMMAQTLGAVFTVMDRHEDLWLGVRGSEPMPVVGEAVPLAVTPMRVDVEHMVDAFRQGLRDLTPIWEHILAVDTLGDVLSLPAPEGAPFAFPDDLWARVVYDFALGHHYTVVHRDHLLRSLVPLYLGRTAAFVGAAEGRSASATEALVEAVGTAFERRKPYLVERWR
jgi:glucosylglycerate synthase